MSKNIDTKKDTEKHLMAKKGVGTVVGWRYFGSQHPKWNSNLKYLIDQYFDENLIGKFSDKDGEFIKEIIRDFVKNYYH